MTDTNALDNATQATQESLAHTADNPSTQVLRAIEIVEEHLREKRSRIEEIQMQHDHLVEEIRQVNKSLESENIDFVQGLSTVIKDLDTDVAIMNLLPDMPAATQASDFETGNADRDRQGRGSPNEKQTKPGSLGWLKKKEKARWET